MQEQVVEFHVGLWTEDFLPEHREGLASQFYREGLVKPEAGDPQTIEIDGERHTPHKTTQHPGRSQPEGQRLPPGLPGGLIARLRGDEILVVVLEGVARWGHEHPPAHPVCTTRFSPPALVAPPIPPSPNGRVWVWLHSPWRRAMGVTHCTTGHVLQAPRRMSWRGFSAGASPSSCLQLLLPPPVYALSHSISLFCRATGKDASLCIPS